MAETGIVEIVRLYIGRGLRAEPFGEEDEKLEVSVDLQDLGEQLDVALDYLGHHLAGPVAALPAAGLVPVGTLYAADDGVVYQSDGAAWTVWATMGGSPAAATQVWMPLFDSDGTAVLDDTGVIPTLIPLT
jgi:hypothetical protein